MYCSKCGKECRDDAKFCIACGAPLQQQTEPEENRPVYYNVRNTDSGYLVKRFVSMYLSKILATFIALGGFFPVIRLNLGILDKTINGEMSLFQLMMNIEKLDDLGIFESDEMSFPALLLGLCFLLYLFCLVGLVSILVKVIRAVSDYRYSEEKIITLLGMISTVFVLIAVVYINNYTANEFYGISIFSMTIWEWLLLFASVINLVLLFRPDSSYLKAN